MKTTTTDGKTRERWRYLPLAPQYKVSDHGRIRHIKTGHLLEPYFINGKLQHRVNLYDFTQGKSWCYNIGRLVLDAFVGPNDELEVMHIDADPLNNHLRNLCYATRAEIIRNMYAKGRNQGSYSSPERAAEYAFKCERILYLYWQRDLAPSEIAKLLRCSNASIHYALNNFPAQEYDPRLKPPARPHSEASYD